MSTSIFTLPEEFNFKLNYNQVAYFLLNFFIGLITFLGLFAAASSIFYNDQDAQQGMVPVMMLIMIPFFIALSIESNAQTTLVIIASLLPFSSLIVMPARLLLVDVPFWHILISCLINVSVLILIFKLAGKIYRVGILITGKKPKWSEVVQWLKLSS